MPIITPTPGDVHVSGVLSNLSMAFYQNLAGFVADKVFPLVPVTKQSDSYLIWPAEAFNRDAMKVRAPGAQTAGTGFETSKQPYYCEVKGVHHPIPDQVIANADNPLAYDNAATQLVTRIAAVNREASWIKRNFSTGVWGMEVEGANAKSAALNPLDPANNKILYWDDAASTPIEDLRKAITFVQLQSGGFRPNTLTLSRLVADVLFDHPGVIARLNAGQTPNGPAVANEASLAAILGLNRVLVMDGVVNAAKEGIAPNNKFFGGKSALLSYAADAPSLMAPSAGYTFAWTGYLGATENGVRVKRFYMQAEASTWVEAESAFDQKPTAPDMAMFLKDVIK